MSPQERPRTIAKVREDYVRMAESHARGQAEKSRATLAQARANRLQLDWAGYAPPRPTFLGTRVFKNYDLAELARYIDWTPFFQTWELKGAFPRILKDDKYGEAARPLYADAQAMLKQLIAEKWLIANGVVGFWPANSTGDDIELYADDCRAKPLATLHTLRQQMARERNRANLALADFVAPKETGVADYIGGFAVTAGVGEEDVARRFERANDDYSKILVKSLADRLAEAFAEALHARVRRELWAYAPDEHLTNEGLIGEEYRGIRPAPGYPAQPDHTEKRTLFKLLDAEKTTGLKLTESCAMWPAAAVSGLYFSHPESRYFGVGKIGRDQVADYASRKGWSQEEAERWLGPILNYDPKAVATAAAE
jgi:5-methyltetrahydrofolate--homocysteine methyltransferase